MSKPAGFEIVELTEAQRRALLERIAGVVSADDFALIAGLSLGVPRLLGLIEAGNMTLGRLRKMVFGAKTEKSATLLPPTVAPPAPAPAVAKPKRKGHGRQGTPAYPGARRLATPHPQLQANQPCPQCPTGKLYPLPPARLLRVVAEPMFQATLHELERLRCGLCGAVFTAPAPPELARGKYDPSVGIMLAIMRYGAGQPHYRMAKCQAWFGVPLPASVQWELVNAAAPAPEAVYDALIGVAAQAPLLHNDDTPMRVQSLRQKKAADPPADGRTGLFTTSILAQADPQPIALFFTGGRHAGENLDQLLQRRTAELTPPLQMCDALSRNQPQASATDLCHCLLHGRRNFVELLPSFPAEARKVIESLREVYRFEAQAKAGQLSDADRLAWHQAQSGPVLAELQQWLQAQLAERQVEPNSGLGQAINYLLNHWTPLTRFLVIPGAPLDNNICERALKMAILHRKNSLSYKTERGARVGDIFMSLIHTCQLGGVNPFNYLTALVQNASQVLRQPARWLPWNYPGAEGSSASA